MGALGHGRRGVRGLAGMTKLTEKIASTIEVTFDTDQFSREDWKAFIKANVRHAEIERVARTDLFPLAKLKERAIAGFKAKRKDWL